tara:strand:+ start:28 stop:651 length:624 start_codon:yes stop_codon:yes gene_type:complete
MGLNTNPGCTLPNKEKSLNPYVSTLGSILVSECCEAEALYRIRDSEKETSFDRWSFCPQCLDSCEWLEVDEDGNPIKELFDEMAEHYSEHGLPVKCNEVPRDQKILPTYEDILKVIEWTEEDKSNGFYDGHFDDLLPWTFWLSDFQHPEREIELLIKLWNGSLEGVIIGKIGEGFIYYFEADCLIYEVVISENMGLDSMSIVAEGEQ